MKMFCVKNCWWITVGSLLIVGGVVFEFVWPTVFNLFWREKLELKPSSESYKLWIKTPISMYLEIYLFNWVNAEEFMKDKNVKPKFEEVGPFVFKEVHERVDVVWNKNYTVSYNQTRTWMFQPDESVDLSVQITNLNVVAIAIARKASQYQKILKLIVDFLISSYKEKLIITRTANQWLFDGMDDKLLDFIKNYVSVPYNKFGWFYGRNLSSISDGRFNVKTGEDDIFQLGALKQWNYFNKTNFFQGDCGAVKGSSGELFAPLKESQNNLTIFISDFCSHLTLNYSGMKKVQGVNGYHYVGESSVFDNGTMYPSKKCFCSGECSPSGVRNVTNCRQAPLFISYPHFYLADPIYTDAVDGLSPNKTDHEFYLSVEPLTGIPLEVRAQLQLNILLQPVKHFSMFSGVPKVYVPMMWFRQRAVITPELASKGEKLRLLGKLGVAIPCGIAFIGLVVILVGILKVFVRRKTPDLLITPEQEVEKESLNSNSES